VCTGGIRCEKATVLFKKEGFKNLYQLKDGIHTYIKKFPRKESFLGKVIRTMSLRRRKMDANYKLSYALLDLGFFSALGTSEHIDGGKEESHVKRSIHPLPTILTTGQSSFMTKRVGHG